MRPKCSRAAKSKANPRVTRKARNRKPAKTLSKILQSQHSGEIPNEILRHILCRCDEGTLRTAMRTCRRWHSVINETIGVSVAIGRPCITFRRKPPVPFQPIEVIEKLGVKYCYVGELTDVHGCPFGYPQTVRNIVFDGPITKFNLITLLSPLPALTHLTMHYTSLENAKFNCSTLNTASLKSLRITSHGIGEEFEWGKAETILDNLISLLMSIHSQQLEVLILDVINMPFYDRKVTTAVFSVLLRHKYSMKNVQYYNFAERVDLDPPGTETSEPETTFIKEDIIAQTIQEAVHLRRISYGGKRDMESEEAWNQLIQQQQSLQEMFYMNDNRDIHSTSIPCLSKNSATLQKTLFHVSGVDEARNVVKFDCRIFKSFQKLSHLLIRGRKVVFPFPNELHLNGEIAIARITIRIPILRNIEHVPSTIIVFSIRDIYVDTESLSKFMDASFLPNLQKFRLVECGSIGNYGIAPKTLIELLKREKLQEIEILKSFSSMHWGNVTGKDIYEDALFYRIKSMSQFHAQRVLGNFCTKDEPMFNYGRFETTLRADDVCEVVFQ